MSFLAKIKELIKAEEEPAPQPEQPKAMTKEEIAAIVAEQLKGIREMPKADEAPKPADAEAEAKAQVKAMVDEAIKAATEPNVSPAAPPAGGGTNANPKEVSMEALEKMSTADINKAWNDGSLKGTLEKILN